MSRTPLKPTPPPAGYVWLAEAACRLGITKSTLYKHRQLGVGPQGVPFGRKIAYRIADIERHIEALYAEATTPNPEGRPAESRRLPARAA